jgi:hypothetical protein
MDLGDTTDASGQAVTWHQLAGTDPYTFEHRALEALGASERSDRYTAELLALLSHVADGRGGQTGVAECAQDAHQWLEAYWQPLHLLQRCEQSVPGADATVFALIRTVLSLHQRVSRLQAGPSQAPDPTRP